MAIYTHYEVANSPSEFWFDVMTDLYAYSPTVLTYLNTDGTVTKAYGNFGMNGGSVLGSVTSLEHTSANGQTVYASITDFKINVVTFFIYDTTERLYKLFNGHDDQVYGYSGDDTLHGGLGTDLLVGGDGQDKLLGDDGYEDIMIGGKGGDVYEIDSLDIVKEEPEEGFDAVIIRSPGTYTLADNVEQALVENPGFSPIHVVGNSLDNSFNNFGAYNILEGGEGKDRFYDQGFDSQLYGGPGDDLYTLEGPFHGFHADIHELPGEGHDTVFSDRYVTTLDANVEDLVLTANFGLTGHGNAGDNSIVGGFGQDYLYGHGGNDDLHSLGGSDFLYGGTGDDEYFVRDGDTVVELANEGIDTITTSQATFTLPDNVENLKFYGKVGFGNELDNDLELAGGLSLELHGLGGNDALRVHGQNGAAVYGGDGDDTVVFSGDLADWSALDLGNRVIMTSGAFTADIQVKSAEHLQFDDGTIHFNDGNALFDTIFYMQQNPDVFHAGANALDHYNTYGRHEGRDPNAWFDTSAYLAANPDVAASGMNPLDHYHQIGWSQGRDAGPKFDTTRYLIKNPDVAAAGVDPLEHFMQFGMAEGRASFRAVGSNIVNGFDAQFYLFNNADVAAAGVDPLAHFQSNGWHEGRDPNAWFDSDGYLATYGDVAAAGVNPLAHYMALGWQEGRDASAMFDTQGYLAANPDVAAAGVNPLQHFLQFGIYEGRALGNDGVWG